MRRLLIFTMLWLVSVVGNTAPNFVLIFCDDLGYGDLSCYGHPSIRTPNLDRMAAEGMRFTEFYAAECVCTPSRAALLTGRYPLRSGMCSDGRRVLFPNSKGGLPAGEITLPEVLKTKGYNTGIVGKWHLGHRPEFLPMRHGFDSWFGLPYSNDMDLDTNTAPRQAGLSLAAKVEWWNVPLMRNGEVIERPADQPSLTKRYTEEAIAFMEQNRERPFFLYLAQTFPHTPLFASDNFRGKSPRGVYGDVVEELDWSVGQILSALKRLKLNETTLVIFTSDNGPWLSQRQAGGSAGLLREGKGSTWEGGMRVPCIACWPGKIKAGVTQRELACTLDLFPTFLKLAAAKVPDDRIIDGMDISPLLFQEANSPRDAFFYYRGTKLFAARKGPFKAHFLTRPGYGPEAVEKHDPPLLFHLTHDPSERFNVAARHPDIVAEIKRLVEAHQKAMLPGKNQLD